jgi:hypothetical protein
LKLPNQSAPSAFATLLLALLLVRVGLLAISQHSVSGDEATVGIMARHILLNRERPVFAYGADYNGGAAVTAYLAAVSFAAFGAKEVALKLIPLAYSLAAVWAVHGLVKSGYGARPAFWAALIYGTSVSLLKWNFDARGGYAECQALIPLTFWLLSARGLSPTGGFWAAASVGLLSGLGTYLLQMFVPVGITCFCFLSLRRNGRVERILGFLAGGIIGASPILWNGAPAGAVGLDPRLLIGRASALPETLWKAVTEFLPGLFSYDNFEAHPPLRLIPNLLEYAFLIVGVGLLLRGGRSFWSARTSSPIAAILTVYSGFYLLLFCLHPLAAASPRYLLFLMPALSILTALGMAYAIDRDGPSRMRNLVLGFFALVLLDRGLQAVRLAGDDRIYGPDGASSPKEAEELIRFLDERGISRLVTEDWDLSWRVVFKTQERVSALHNINNLHQVLPFVVVAQNSEDDQRIRALLAKRADPVERVSLRGKAVYAVGVSSRPSSLEGDKHS